MAECREDPRPGHTLRVRTAERLRGAVGDPEATADAIRRFIEECWVIEPSPMAIWDYFAISSPTVPRMAQLGPAAEQEVEARFATLMDRFVAMLQRDQVYEPPFPAGWAERDD